MNVAEKKGVVVEFLTRCNRYADDQLAKYRAQLESAATAESLHIQDKIGHWTAYRAFNRHALEELAAGELDDWFA